jgi:hypothetical protein
MCGRFTLTWDQWRRVADRLDLAADAELSLEATGRAGISRRLTSISS